MKVTKLLAAALVLVSALFAGLSGSATETMREMTGSVSYRERIALPPAAIIEVKLLDVSLADAPAITIAEAIIAPSSQVPIPFTLSYDSTKIIPAHRYALQATISVDGKLMFTSDRHWPVLNNSSARTDILLVRAHDTVN